MKLIPSRFATALGCAASYGLRPLSPALTIAHCANSFRLLFLLQSKLVLWQIWCLHFGSLGDHGTIQGPLLKKENFLGGPGLKSMHLVGELSRNNKLP